MGNKTVSVILPTYNEKDSIYQVVNDFFASGLVDEVIVVNNNAVPGTDEEVRKTRAKLIHEEKQGYGYAIQRGLEEAQGEYIVISEPDGTFMGKDIAKLLAYSDDFDYVLGTRTHSGLILKGANMGKFLKYGNRMVAKMMKFLFNSHSLTDMGCTMRLIHRTAYEKIKDKFTIGGSHFGPEMTLLVILNKIKYVEIPVNYGRRVGESSVTGSKLVAFFLGLKMINLVFLFWFRKMLGKQSLCE